jgi:hypothetical protein
LRLEGNARWQFDGGGLFGAFCQFGQLPMLGIARVV